MGAEIVLNHLLLIDTLIQKTEMHCMLLNHHYWNQK